MNVNPDMEKKETQIYQHTIPTTSDPGQTRRCVKYNVSDTDWTTIN